MSHDTLIHRLVRPGVGVLAAVRATPNQVTTARLLTGLAAAAAFCAGGELWTAIGAGALLVSLLLDRADGELARRTGQMSLAGYRYDLISDCVCNAAVFLGLGAGLYALLGAVAWVLGIMAAVSVVAIFYHLNMVPSRGGGGGERQGQPLADPDDAMVLIPFLVWLGLAPAVLVIAGTVTPMAAIVLSLLAFRRVAHREGKA